jgi:hypothetical protein
MLLVVWHRRRQTVQASTSCSRIVCKTTLLTFRVRSFESVLCKGTSSGDYLSVACRAAVIVCMHNSSQLCACMLQHGTGQSTSAGA